MSVQDSPLGDSPVMTRELAACVLPPRSGHVTPPKRGNPEGALPPSRQRGQEVRFASTANDRQPHHALTTRLTQQASTSYRVWLRGSPVAAAPGLPSCRT